MVETQIDNSVRDFAQRLSYQGMNLDMYMQYTGMTMDALRAQFAEQAKKQQILDNNIARKNSKC